MSLSKDAREEIKLDILKQIRENLLDINGISQKHHISRQTVYRYLRNMKEQGIIGQKQNKEFVLRAERWRHIYKNTDLAEGEIWRQDIAPQCKDIPQNAYEKTRYIFAEMMNNAIEHSESGTICVFIDKAYTFVGLGIIDLGVGIFHKIQSALQLPEKSFAILELAKGKLTTAPQGHSGEGIFFSSRIADKFAIYSEGLVFESHGGKEDTLYDDKTMPDTGTMVCAEINFDSPININEVFSMYTEHPEHIGFNATQVPVKLLDYGAENPIFVSRSEARRLLTRFERFAKITLDFAGVEDIRQGFADEVFRVFPQAHPDCKLETINCNERVQAMIDHVRNTK